MTKTNENNIEEKRTGAAFRLEFGEHRLLAVDAGRLANEQPLGQVLLVERLEHVLAVNESEKELIQNKIFNS